MSTKPRPPAPGAGPLLKNVGAAPFVYFDSVPVFGTYAGNLEVELGARVLLPKADGDVIGDMSCTGHLRCAPQAAVLLINALTKGLEMLSKQQEEPSELLKN